MDEYALLHLAAKWQGIFYILSLVAILTFLLRTRYRKGLRNVPGPFYASILPFDRLLTAASGRECFTHIRYHEKYGPLVRIGPNHVSISDAACIPQIYGLGTKFYKSMFYSLFDVKARGKLVSSVFSIRDESQHKALKRPVANAYSMSSMVELEPMTNECIKILEKKLDSKQGENVNFGEWLQWYSFDVITSITFSSRIDFMEQEKDVLGIIDAIEGRLAYTAVVGQVPTMHQYLLGNETVASIANWIPVVARLASAGYVTRFILQQLERYKVQEKSTELPRDMLARFKTTRDGEERMTDADLFRHAATNIFAGSDTTAISLRAMFYYLCKNRRCYELAVQEIDELDGKGELSDPISFAEASRMKACMKEAMRIHPAVGKLLERMVPDGGATVAGVWLPEETIVGINPWVSSRDKLVYGEDVEDFRPERWLNADPETLKLMDRNYLAFGAGARTCMGKNVSLLEMSKLVPQLLRRYSIELSDPKADWTLVDYWFVKQTNFICRMSKRKR